MDSKIINYTIIILLIFLKVNAVEFEGKFIQGHFIIGKTEPNTKILIDKKDIKVSKDGYFAFGIGKDRKFDIIITEGNKTIVKKIQKRKYKIQKIDGLPKKKVTPPEEFYERIKKENKLIVNAREINSNLTFFREKFILPVDDAIVTGVYGSQRILNGIPKWPHYGLDFAQKKGTPIKAMNNGVATLVEEDLFYTGATLIFDHGHGISTLYMHLDKIFVNKGDHVKKGEIIGTVGSSGRSTGPHLDVRLNWFGIRLDPATILNIQ
ncbi:peptidoglycan DD-metalloendopeptidase family protein [Candidatus Pelagibacter sp.]|nr:peptidoglycan DD-metalloendopeptidase family protein [Candidatus Pelagibacter sp.]